MKAVKITPTIDPDESIRECIKQDKIIWRAEKRRYIVRLIALANRCIRYHVDIVNVNPDCGRLTEPLAHFAKNVIIKLEDIAVEDYSESSHYTITLPWDQEYETILNAQRQYLDYVLYREKAIVKTDKLMEQSNEK